MASPMPIPPMHSWNGQGSAMPPAPQQEQLDSGMQVRPMSLKVHYTFDREAKVNCLARYAQTLHVHTVPVDDTNTIGVVDLRFCIQAVTECSPELASSHDTDYTIYAHDYSEPDTPLVGQGMLSWTLDLMNGDLAGEQPPKMVTGRVTKNILGVFGGHREILEVKLKLSASARAPRAGDAHRSIETPQSMPPQQPVPQQPQNRQMEPEMAPAAPAAEWNSFIMSNPQIGQGSNMSRGASPALSQGRPPMGQERRSSFAQAPSQPTPAQEVQRVAPTPVEPPAAKNANAATSSRPSSRTSNRPPRKKPPTGRPRGRPRKKPVEGNTSGYEDGTEGEDGPAKKKAKTVQVDKSAANPFAPEFESLRVAASTSGSLRDFRPVRMSNDSIAGRQVQEVPRAPTPVPDRSGPGIPGRGSKQTNLRRASMMNREMSVNQPSPADSQQGLSPNQDDGRSPDSIAPTPSFSDDSPADIGSSPPIPRARSYIQSSPPASSPMLPPMPQPDLLHDVSIGLEDLDDLFGEELLVPQPIQPSVEKAAVPDAPRQSGSRRASYAIPVQVFRMEDGPLGQDMVHVRSYNTPDLSSLPAAPAEIQVSMPKPRPVRPPKKKTQKSSPSLVPTPPPTTDGPSKPGTPMLAPETLPGPMPELPTAPSFESLPEIAESQSEANMDNLPTLPQQMRDETSLPQTLPPHFPRPAPNDATMAPAVAPASIPSALPENQSTQTLSQQPATDNNRTAKPPAKPRKLARSQSAGPLVLPIVPASEPAGPSSLSQSIVAEPETSPVLAPAGVRRAASTGPLNIPMPASDPVGPISSNLHLPVPTVESSCPPSDMLPPPSSPGGRPSNKNIVKKHAIKQRLEEAIMNGEMPPYCSNCGAIETPTWRKIWVQDHDGVPEYVEYSSKPGRILAIEVLTRDEAERPTTYRLIKKSLGGHDDKTGWRELLLCNPCGIWLVKCNGHRPKDRWEKDASRLGQDRRKRGASGAPGNSRSKKARSKSDSQPNLTSEAYLPTDALGPTEPSPLAGDAATSTELGDAGVNSRPNTQDAEPMAGESFGNSQSRSNPGSARSNRSGTAKTPEEVQFDEAMGSTKRLLFPSPRKDGSPRTLTEVDVNIVQTSGDCGRWKDTEAEKENSVVPQSGSAVEGESLETLFGTPAPARPSTPPPNAKASAAAGPFKTPNRPTPSHRPITRSVSRSLKSSKFSGSPSRQALQQTPSRTPRGTLLSVQRSGSVRRSPRHQHEINFESSLFDTPISRAVSQMLSEPNFGLGDDLDLSNLPVLEDGGSLLDYGGLLSTDAPLPSSPPRSNVGFDYHGSTNIWEEWHVAHGAGLAENEE